MNPRISGSRISIILGGLVALLAVVVIVAMVLSTGAGAPAAPAPATATAVTPTNTSAQASTVAGPTAAPDMRATTVYLSTMVARTQTAIDVKTQDAATATPQPTNTPRVSLGLAEQLELLQRLQSESGVAVGDFPREWPLTPFDDAQVRDAQACNIRDLFATRYKNLDEDELLSIAPQTACDWAVLAAAYGYVAGTADPGRPVSDAGKLAYQTAVAGNPALAARSWLIYGDFGPGSLVKAPPFAQQPVTSVMMTFSFGGIGYQATSTAIITHADSDHPEVTGHVHEVTDFVEEGQTPLPPERPVNAEVDPALVQALGASLTDLVPIDHQFRAIACYDYYPGWDILIVYADGTTVSLSTNGTNFLGGGGPWQVAIDGQDYMHVSSAIPSAVNALANQLNIPGGATSAMACGGSDDLLDISFPER